MGKKIIGDKTYLCKMDDNIFKCKIECVGTDEYYVYGNNGEGGCIYKLNTAQMLELYLTGEYENSSVHLSEFKQEEKMFEFDDDGNLIRLK